MGGPVAVLDANVLHPASQRDLFLRLAAADLYQLRWTLHILDETFRSVLRTRPDLDSERLARTRRLMTEHFPEAMVHDYEDLIDRLVLPDPDDRHVLAAAVRCHASVVVTSNVRDFPVASLRPFGIEVRRPDALLLELIDERPLVVLDVLREQAGDSRRPPMALPDLIRRLEEVGLRQSMAELRRLLR